MKPDERCLLAARQCTASQLRRASRAAAHLYDRLMAPAGLEGTQFTLLVALSLAGEVPMKKLAERLALDRTTLTRNLGPLEKKGWVRIVAGADRRVRLVRLTESGARALEKALPLWQEAQERMVEALGKTRWSELLSLLKSVEKVSE